MPWHMYSLSSPVGTVWCCLGLLVRRSTTLRSLDRKGIEGQQSPVARTAARWRVPMVDGRWARAGSQVGRTANRAGAAFRLRGHGSARRGLDATLSLDDITSIM